MARRVILLCVAVALAGATAAPAQDDGLVPEAFVEARALEYLEFATAVQSDDSILNAIAHMERERVDPGYVAPVGAIDVGDWSRSFEKFDKLLDTRDFDGLYVLNALLGYEGHPYVTPEMWEAVRQALLSFKFWFTDPTPVMPDPGQPDRTWDDSFYWTENHQILYHTIEYLAGQRFPGSCFWIAGFPPTADCSGPGEMTGAAHMARARAWIMRWLDERWRFGFAEWHSNVYYQKDATPLLTLVEHAQDPEIATRAAMILDVLLLDLATHTHRSVLGVTHGRSQMKDKHRGPANDTWGLVLLLFGQQDEVGYASRGDAGATLFARAQRYRMPRLILEAANDPRSFEDVQRMSVPLDERGPVVDDPAHPPGHGFDDTEANFTFWWGLGAWTAWQVVPLTVQNAERYNLWPTSLLQPFQPLRDLLGDPPDIELGKQLAVVLWPLASLGLLKEVDTYTWRTQDYVLSTAQDYRKGANGGEYHAWQATFDSEALVFTQHPMNPLQPPSEWIGRTDGQPGYWSGTASMPRGAQHENVGIYVYSPLYADGGFGGFLDFEAMTHAYFPQDHFDEVVQAPLAQGRWTMARHDDAYIALYSWRDTVWESYDAAELALLEPSAGGPITSSFDLVAPGGPDNVWIVECGRAADWGSFAAFRDAILDSLVVVTPRPGTVPGIQEFDVAFDSPSQGLVTFGWDAPFVVDGREITISGYPRIRNPWVHVQREASRMVMRGSDSMAVLDWNAGVRTVPEPGAAAASLASLAATALLGVRRARPARPRPSRAG